MNEEESVVFLKRSNGGWASSTFAVRMGDDGKRREDKKVRQEMNGEGNRLVGKTKELRGNTEIYRSS